MSEYIRVKKEFLERKPNTSYEATNTGKVAFKKHLNAIENLLN
ncbi:MAG: transcriptional regulator [Bacteroidota bacterium]